ncbi:MAG: hypothetical protein KUG77_20535 [Nannocystaceae bacterium]|nr:hypothetical protein [Nannocystaceae bacterium]
MEGNKAFILPAVAALVFLGLLVLRSQATPDSEPAESSPPPPGTEAIPKGVKAQIREAVTAAGDPVLEASTSDRVRAALEPVVDRCRSARPDSATLPIKVAVEIITAKTIGLRVERAEIQGDLPPDLLGCVREGMLGSKPGDVGQTGRFSGTLEYATP